MTLSKVVRKGSYQGVSQWGISTSSEITPSRTTAQKWADLENARILDRERIHAENLARVTSPAYKRAERAVSRQEKTIRRAV
jgi:hypothetical protein